MNYMTDILDQLGFKKTSSCRCGGYLTEKYDLSAYRIEVRPTKYVAKIKKSGASLTDWIPFKQLETSLKNIEDLVRL